MLVLKEYYLHLYILTIRMSSKNLSSFKKIGYQSILPKGADINDYESITLQLKEKSAEKIILYRYIKEKTEIDETTNFQNSWNIFNHHL